MTLGSVIGRHCTKAPLLTTKPMAVNGLRSDPLLCYHRRVRALATLIFLLVASSAGAAGDGEEALATARRLYNTREYEGAINAANMARASIEHVDSADLIAARAYLEQYRASGLADHLISGRDRLRRVDPQRLSALERLEWVVGLGEALYFEEFPGAAASVFESVLADGYLLGLEARDRVLDWWASAMDGFGRPRSDLERQSIYQRVRDRMRDEMVLNPTSAAAPYWLAAAAAAQGDWAGAWDGVLAGWVRAPLTSDHGAALRADLDRLTLRAIVPERAKLLARPAEDLLAEWEAFKLRWTKKDQEPQ
jgi:hypothetical protein